MTKPGLKAMMLLIVGTILIIIFVVLALLLAPQQAIPEFEITDQQGVWRAQGEIAVFDSKIHPGRFGSYEFIIKNESTERLIYGFRLSEYLKNSNQDVNPFMQYRLKVNGDYVGDGEWHYVGIDYNNLIILPSSELLMTLEWHWPFESGQDRNDTLIGTAGGELGVNLFLWAEVVYD